MRPVDRRAPLLVRTVTRAPFQSFRPVDGVGADERCLASTGRGATLARLWRVRTASATALLAALASCAAPAAGTEGCSCGVIAADDFAGAWSHALELDEGVRTRPEPLTWAHAEDRLFGLVGEELRLAIPVLARLEVRSEPSTCCGFEIDDATGRAPLARSHLRVDWSINLVVPEAMIGPGFEPAATFADEMAPSPRLDVDADGALRRVEVRATYVRPSDAAVTGVVPTVERVD